MQHYKGNFYSVLDFMDGIEMATTKSMRKYEQLQFELKKKKPLQLLTFASRLHLSSSASECVLKKSN